jgi:hypothetical protein
MKLEDVRDLFAYMKALPPVSGKVLDTTCLFPSASDGWLEAGNCCFCRAGYLNPIRQNRRNGTAALTW